MDTLLRLALARRKFTSATALSTTLSASTSVMALYGKLVAISK